MPVVTMRKGESMHKGHINYDPTSQTVMVSELFLRTLGRHKDIVGVEPRIYNVCSALR
jgi:hypothetical protein